MTGWIMTRPDQLTDADRASLDAILAASPELAAVTASVRAFAVIMTERRGRKQHWTGYAGDTYGAGSGYSCRWSSRLSCSRPCSNGSRVTRPGGPTRDQDGPARGHRRNQNLVMRTFPGRRGEGPGRTRPPALPARRIRPNDRPVLAPSGRIFFDRPRAIKYRA